jgi:hypothetical protein
LNNLLEHHFGNLPCGLFTAIPCGQFAAVPRGQFAAIRHGRFTTIPSGQFTAIPRGQFPVIPCEVRTSLYLTLSLRGASPTLYHTTCPLPPHRWDFRTVNGLSTATHPPPQHLPFFTGRRHTQAGWGHAVTSLPPPLFHRSRLNRGVASNSTPLYLPPPRSAVRPHLGPALFEMG